MDEQEMVDMVPRSQAAKFMQRKFKNIVFACKLFC